VPSGPIQVDFLPRAAHGLRGALGLTIAPGRWRPGLDPASDTLVRDDLRRLRDDLGAEVLVTLLEELEMRRHGISSLLPAARRMRLESIWFPIPDVSIPASVDDTAVVVDQVLGHVSGGRTVVVHCLGGLGRSGTIAACCLTRLGREPREAIELVRAARPGAVEVPSQVDFVARFAALHRPQG
jgi:hypothetical protein